jgi:hypothetical protein
MNPPLPLLSEPAPKPVQYSFGQGHPHIAVKDIEKSRVQARQFLSSEPVSIPATTVQPPNTDKQQVAGEQNDIGTAQAAATGEIIDNEDKDMQKSLEENFSTMKLVTTHLSKCPFHRSTHRAALSSVNMFSDTNLQPDTTGDEPDDPDAAQFRPHIIHSPHDPIPMVLVNRKPRGSVYHVLRRVPAVYLLNDVVVRPNARASR